MKIVLLIALNLVLCTQTYSEYYNTLLKNVQQKLAFLQKDTPSQNSEQIKALMDLEYQNTKEIQKMNTKIDNLESKIQSNQESLTKKLDSIAEMLKKNASYVASDFEMDKKFEPKV